MKKIDPGFIIPSAAYTISKKTIKYYAFMEKKPEVGDLVFGEVTLIGEHAALENKNGRIHVIDNGSRAIFVFGNRYAPDAFEGEVPNTFQSEADIIARSGIIGELKHKNTRVKDPSRVKILGYVCDKDGNVINTRNYPVIIPKHKELPPDKKRSKLILVCGSSMNSGKTMTAVVCCWALRTLGYNVRASKVTGTASLKDILYMNDAGADIYNDFTFLGYPSTYRVPENEVLDIFTKIDLKYGNDPKNFWVVEFADGILQRETAFLLQSPQVTSRIYRLIFAANSAFECIGGLKVLKEDFGLVPHAISGVISSSILSIKELQRFSSIPVFNNFHRNLEQLKSILL